MIQSSAVTWELTPSPATAWAPSYPPAARPPSHFLVAKGRTDEAGTVVREIEGDGAPIAARLEEIARSLRENDTSRLRDLLDRRFVLVPIAWAEIGLAVFQRLAEMG